MTERISNRPARRTGLRTGVRAARAAAALLALVAAVSPAKAESDLVARTLTEADRQRIDNFAATRAEVLGDVRPELAAGDARVLDEVLGTETLPILGTDLVGEYRCRTVKLGGPLPFVAYGWFDCRIKNDDLGYRLDKTSGSQRLSGHFIDAADDRLLYYGALHYADEPVKGYGDDPERDQVGYLFRTGEGRYRLELPRPRLESAFDILEIAPR